MLFGTLVYGFINSSILALLAMGFNITFGISGVANFAYGAIYIFARFPDLDFPQFYRDQLLPFCRHFYFVFNDSWNSGVSGNYYTGKRIDPVRGHGNFWPRTGHHGVISLF